MMLEPSLATMMLNKALKILIRQVLKVPTHTLGSSCTQIGKSSMPADLQVRFLFVVEHKIMFLPLTKPCPHVKKSASTDMSDLHFAWCQSFFPSSMLKAFCILLFASLLQETFHEDSIVITKRKILRIIRGPSRHHPKLLIQSFHVIHLEQDVFKENNVVDNLRQHGRHYLHQKICTES